MQITAILLKNYRQFRSLYLPLVDPETNEPLQNVCFIGANATGKSTLLALIAKFLETGIPQPVEKKWDHDNCVIGFKVRVNCDEFYVVGTQSFEPFIVSAQSTWVKSASWHDLWEPDVIYEKSGEALTLISTAAYSNPISFDEIQLKPNQKDLAIYAPPDGTSLLRKGGLARDLPATDLNHALLLVNNLPAFHTVSYEEVERFWDFLIYQITKRERDRNEFLNSPNVQSLSVAQARQQFNETYPDILEDLAHEWNLILDRAGLVFDTKNVKVPYQSDKNLEAYIKRKSTGETIAYNSLSTGIRNFIFRFGHIYSLYFNRQIDRGFLLIDEPELSLFPDLLYDIIERYKSIIQNTQFFVATHSPVIAAQFEACERIVLEFDDHATVQWRRGISPEGDDPNDLLVNDFAVRSLYGKKGIEQWEKFLRLRREIAAATDPQTKLTLLDEYAKIGNAYNFAPDEIPA
ncbi:MAG: AAA family ATPase [Caldilineaceae bacterium]